MDLPLILETVKDVNVSSPRSIDYAKTWFIVYQLVKSCTVENIFVDRSVQQALQQYALAQGISKEELAMILQYRSFPPVLFRTSIIIPFVSEK